MMSQSKVGKSPLCVQLQWPPDTRHLGLLSYLFYYHIHFDTSSDVGLFLLSCWFCLPQSLYCAPVALFWPLFFAWLVSMLCLKGLTSCSVLPILLLNHPQRPLTLIVALWLFQCLGLCLRSLAAVFPSSALAFFLLPAGSSFCFNIKWTRKSAWKRMKYARSPEKVARQRVRFARES